MTSAGSDPNLEALERELLGAIAGAADLPALELVRVSALGKKGRISELMARLGSMAPDARKTFGQAVNEIKGRVTDALDARRSALDVQALS
jgi:phenylalanyl-tRNA synthetase alpha chain